MNAVGRVGSFFAQSVYTVSGPFHPFGGAVDIIVVQQEDGTFKTSPWYVKFGKFQGVLKRTEKKVVVAVNGSDASFHMHLDHKGEAYFLKDSTQGEDGVLALPSPEAASSGDEFSHPTLAIEYPKGEEEGADARAEHGKEESEDERGDDLELRFEGREASKQLIQQSVEERAAIAAAAAEEIEPLKLNFDSGVAEAAGEIEPPKVNFNSEVEVAQIPNIAEQGSGNIPALETSHIVELPPEAASEQNDPEKCDSNVQVSLPPTNEDSGLKLIRKSTPARTLIAQAVLAALNPPASPLMEDATTTAPVPETTAPVLETTASVPERKKNRNNGLLIHGLLNQAVGLQPNQSSGLASSLIATAALQSLRRVLSDGTTPPLPEKREDQSVVPVGPGAVLGGELSEEVLGAVSLLNPVAVDSMPSYEGSLRDLMLPTTFSSSGGVQSESAEPLLIDFPSRSPSSPRQGVLEHGTVLEVTRVDVVDDSVVVEVETHDDDKDSSGTTTPERETGSPLSVSNGRIEKIVIDRKEILEKVLHLQGGSDEKKFHGRAGTDTAENLGGVNEKGTQQPEEGGDPIVTVNVDKHLLDSLNEAMLETDPRSPHVVLTDEKDIAAVVGKDEGQIASEEVAIVSKEGEEIGYKSMNSVPMHELTPAAIVSKEGEETGSKSTNSVPMHELIPVGKELALANSMNLADVGSPRLKAELELELAWRCVIEKAATSLKVAPYTSKSIQSSSFNKQLSSSSDNGKKSPDGMLPEQAEKKTWGGWFWGSAPPSKRNSDLSSLEGPKIGQGDTNPELRVSDLGKGESGDQSGPMLDGYSGSSSRIHDSKGQSGEKLGQIGRDPGVEDHVDSEGNVQQKGSDIPPPRRRSIFGLLSRTTTNQSSLSTVSSLQSSDDIQPVSDALKREDSLERAEIVVDLLEEKWARGTEASKNMMAITRGSGARVSKDSQHSKVTNGNREVKNVGVIHPQVDAEGNCQPIMAPDDSVSCHGLVDKHKDSHSSSDSVGAAAAVGQVMREPEEGVSQRLLAAGDTGGHQHEAELATVGADVEHTSTGVESDRGHGEFNSAPQVILMRVNGHLVTAPLLPVENEFLRDSPDSNQVIDNDGVANWRPSQSLQEPVISLVDGPDGRLIQTSSSPELRKDEEELHHTPRDALPEPDGSMRSDSKEDIEETHSCRGSSALDELETDDNFGQSQTKVETLHTSDVDRLAVEWPGDKSGPTLVNKVFLGISESDRGIVDSVKTEGLKPVRTLVFDQPDEHNDEEVADLDELGMERYYSSKDLTEIEESGERKVFRRNMSEYMDAIAADDEQDSDGSGHEKESSKLRDVSSPISIPGALEQIRSYQFSDNIYLPRSNSESLPNVRHLVVGDSEMSSPRLQLSRSLDSPLPKLLPSVDNVTATGASDSTTFTGLERATDSSVQPERAIEKVEEKPIIGRTPSVLSSSKNGGEKSLETGFELSVCRQQLTEEMGLDAAAQVFDSAKVTLEDFKSAGSLIAINENLVVRVGGRYYSWAVAAPIVLGILAFGQVLVAPNEGAIPVEKAVVEVDGNETSQALTSHSSSGWFWPFKGSRASKTPEKEISAVTASLMSRDALELATQAALKSRLTEEYLRMNGYYKRQRKVRTNSPSSQQLASLNLKEGRNSITFTFETRMLGKQQVHARIFLWQWNTRIVISDVDGTITKSDVLGQVMPLVGKDWTQSGVARLFSAIKKNGYELMFLSARAISQSHITRQFLENIKQDGEGLPHGPVVISPDGLFPSLYREVIRRAPHEFKIACLEDIKSLFPPETKPFYAGFGNRDTDELSYLKVGISKGKIFIINPKGEVVVNNRVDVKSYTSLHKLVDDMFPAMTFTEQEDYNEWNFWKLPLPDVDDSPSMLSLGSSSSRRSGKGSSGRHS